MTMSLSKNHSALPWAMWLSGLGIVPQTKRSPVWFPVGHTPELWDRLRGGIVLQATDQCLSPFLSPSLPLSLKINKIFSNKWKSLSLYIWFPGVNLCGCFLYVSTPGMEPTTLVHGENTLTNWATQPGQEINDILKDHWERHFVNSQSDSLCMTSPEGGNHNREATFAFFST